MKELPYAILTSVCMLLVANVYHDLLLAYVPGIGDDIRDFVRRIDWHAVCVTISVLSIVIVFTFASIAAAVGTP